MLGKMRASLPFKYKFIGALTQNQSSPLHAGGKKKEDVDLWEEELLQFTLIQIIIA